MDYFSYEQGRQQGHREGNNNGDGGLLLALLAALLLLWACLYPLSVLAAGAAWYVALQLLEPLGRNLEGFNRVLITGILPIAAGLVVLWKTSRLDHRLSARPAYRKVRHVVRIALLTLTAGIIHLWLQNNIPVMDQLRPVVSGWMTAGEATARTMRLLANDPVRLGTMAGTAILAHLWLAHWQCGRRGWQELLQALRLRQAV